MNRKTVRCDWLTVLLSVVYAAVMLTLEPAALNRLWSADPYHRYQAVALLHRHFSLAGSVNAMQPGLVWYNGDVQQVWGLGVGFWLAPFQAIWRFIGGDVFPDRVALGVAFGLLAFYTVNTALRMAAAGHRVLGLGFAWLVLLCPPLWTLARVSEPVFEQTVLYAVLVSLGILVLLVRVAWFNSLCDYWLCCGLSGFAAWVRPTHGIYGLGAVLIGSLLIWFRRRAIRTAVLGTTIFSLGLVSLATTNRIRFGSPMEFGHRLTASSGSMVYLTRFGNPFRQATLGEAAEELTGLLFLDSKVSDAYAYSRGQFPGQAPETRWRRLYLTAFDPWYALACLAALAGMIAGWMRIWRKGWRGARQESFLLMNVLFLWSSISLAGLATFYLYFPVISSRYLLDFAPAMVGYMMCAWLLIPLRWGRLFVTLLGAWLVCEIALSKAPANLLGMKGVATESSLPHEGTNHVNSIVSYSAGQAQLTGLPWNGYGWRPNGFADDVVTLMVSHPKYIKLRVDNRLGMYGQPARPDRYRAMIDGRLLQLRQIVPAPFGWKVIFEVPGSLQSRGTELLFLCFSNGYDAEDRVSDRLLYSVKWR